MITERNISIDGQTLNTLFSTGKYLSITILMSIKSDTVDTNSASLSNTPGKIMTENASDINHRSCAKTAFGKHAEHNNGNNEQACAPAENIVQDEQSTLRRHCLALTGIDVPSLCYAQPGARAPPHTSITPAPARANSVPAEDTVRAPRTTPPAIAESAVCYAPQTPASATKIPEPIAPAPAPTTSAYLDPACPRSPVVCPASAPPISPVACLDSARPAAGRRTPAHRLEDRLSPALRAWLKKSTCYLPKPEKSDDTADYAYLAELHDTPQEKLSLTKIIVHIGGTAREVMLKESPIYPDKCQCWKDRSELTRKTTLEALLKQCKNIDVLAKYLNCSRQQIYAALKHHGIERARYTITQELHDSLHLN